MGHNIGANPRKSKSAKTEKAKAGALNQYGARFLGWKL